MLFPLPVYLINRLPTPILCFSSPYEILFNCKPNYNKLHVFGYLCFPWLKPYTAHKLEPKSSPYVFLGYSPNQSAYFCMDKNTKIYTSRQVCFIENEFPFTNISSTISSPDWYVFSHLVPSSLPLSPTEQRPSPSDAMLSPLHLLSRSFVNLAPPLSPRTSTSAHSYSILNNFSSSSPISPLVPPLLSSPSLLSISQPLVPIPPPQPPPPSKPSTHPMTNKSKNNIFKPKCLYQTSITHPLPVSLEPTCISQAIKHIEWREVMSDEITTLFRNST